MKAKYTPSATMERKSDLTKTKQYYPLIKFCFENISDSYVINLPQENRGEALKIARKHIKEIKIKNR